MWLSKLEKPRDCADLGQDERGGRSLSLTFRLFRFYAEVREGHHDAHSGLLNLRARLIADDG
jgi:hypothetical protein